MTYRLALMALTLGCFGCTAQMSQNVATDIKAISDALESRGISHCLMIQATVVPYGRAYLFAKVGDLPCQDIWQHMMQFGY
jgi:hypothetical protein